MIVIVGIALVVRRAERIVRLRLNDLAMHLVVAIARKTGAFGLRPPLCVGMRLGVIMRLGIGRELGDQPLAIGDRNPIVVGMNLVEGEEAMAVAAILDESCLQRRLYPRDLREVDVALQL